MIEDNIEQLDIKESPETKPEILEDNKSKENGGETIELETKNENENSEELKEIEIKEETKEINEISLGNDSDKNLKQLRKKNIEELETKTSDKEICRNCDCNIF